MSETDKRKRKRAEHQAMSAAIRANGDRHQQHILLSILIALMAVVALRK